MGGVGALRKILWIKKCEIRVIGENKETDALESTKVTDINENEAAHAKFRPLKEIAIKWNKKPMSGSC